MKKIVAFGASNSKNSINQQFAKFTASQIPNSEVQIVDLNNFEMPIYSIDRENKAGIPQLAKDFKRILHEADGIIISFAEHNGAYSTAFKNIFDWISRMGKDIWGNKPMLLLATAPGPMGGKTVLQLATARIGRSNPNMVAHFSLPQFALNFSKEKGVSNVELKQEFLNQLDIFIKALN